MTGEPRQADPRITALMKRFRRPAACLTSKDVLLPAQHPIIVPFPQVARSHILVSFPPSHIWSIPTMRLAS